MHKCVSVFMHMMSVHVCAFTCVCMPCVCFCACEACISQAPSVPHRLLANITMKHECLDCNVYCPKMCTLLTLCSLAIQRSELSFSLVDMKCSVCHTGYSYTGDNGGVVVHKFMGVGVAPQLFTPHACRPAIAVHLLAN